MTTTQNQISRIAQDWSKIAKEPVKVENVSGTIYGFCSEIAALRLANKYRNSGDSAKADFSKNLNTWFFRIELAN
ncbi:MAG: hypothetical protein ACK5YV_12785 [Betaproteobacteria bacterium]|jgi:hypothetical protein